MIRVKSSWYLNSGTLGSSSHVRASDTRRSRMACQMCVAQMNDVRGQMQLQPGIWKKFIRSLLGVDRCSLSRGSGRSFLEVYQISVWADAASAGDLEKVY